MTNKLTRLLPLLFLILTFIPSFFTGRILGKISITPTYTPTPTVSPTPTPTFTPTPTPSPRIITQVTLTKTLQVNATDQNEQLINTSGLSCTWVIYPPITTTLTLEANTCDSPPEQLPTGEHLITVVVEGNNETITGKVTKSIIR